MAALNLQIDETDPTLKKVYGRYSDWKAFGILTRYLEPGSDLSEEQATELLYEILPKADDKKLAGQPDMLGCVLLDIAKQIPYYHPSQIRLLKLFKHLGKTDRMTLHSIHPVIQPCFMTKKLTDMYYRTTNTLFTTPWVSSKSLYESGIHVCIIFYFFPAFSPFSFSVLSVDTFLSKLEC